ncbi:MAG TPA: DUF4157 domain-containing protein [Micromonosporaceae bacterium]|nr:DUF4157 domain-containing protein [Micromonosporaceae bacterium]
MRRSRHDTPAIPRRPPPARAPILPPPGPAPAPPSSGSTPALASSGSAPTLPSSGSAPALAPSGSMPGRSEHLAGPVSSAAQTAHERVVRGPGAPLDAATRDLAHARWGFDFSGVRVHHDERADEAAYGMAAQAYSWADRIVFRQGRYAPHTDAGRSLLLHELGHVAEQGREPGRPPVVLRQPAPPSQSPGTYIIVYGSGRVNPETPVDHNVGQAFKLAAEAKRREIVARLGKQAGQNTIVFEYTPTEDELKNVLNKAYPLPVQEIHVFSHGWDEGANLGGPEPAPGKKAPDTEPQKRRLIKEDLGDYRIQFADQPTVVFYGCNIGNLSGVPFGDPPFAQQFSDEFGVRVVASTTSSHFAPGPFGLSQVPDKPGVMKEFTPSAGAVDARLKQAESLVDQIVAKVKQAKGGLLKVIKATQEAYALQARLDQQLRWLNRVLADPRFPVADRAARKSQVDALAKRARAALK